MSAQGERIIHGTCVAWEDRGLLILGASGSGKSSLALSLMAFGATLVSDDRVILAKVERDVTAAAPDGLRGLVEARGLGLLTAEVSEPVKLCGVVDMDETEQTRLPKAHWATLLGERLPLVYRVDAPHFAAGLLQMLKSGRHTPI